MNQPLFRIWNKKKKRWLEGEALGLKIDEQGRIYDDYARLPADQFIVCFPIEIINSMRAGDASENYLEYDPSH